MSDFTFNRAHRLKHTRDVQAVFSNTDWIAHTTHLTLLVRFATPDTDESAVSDAVPTKTRLCVLVGKKSVSKKAVARNRVRRLAREAFRHSRVKNECLPANWIQREVPIKAKYGWLRTTQATQNTAMHYNNSVQASGASGASGAGGTSRANEADGADGANGADDASFVTQHVPMDMVLITKGKDLPQLTGATFFDEFERLLTLLKPAKRVPNKNNKNNKNNKKKPTRKQPINNNTAKPVERSTNTMSSNTMSANTISSDTMPANAMPSNTMSSNTMSSNTMPANTTAPTRPNRAVQACIAVITRYQRWISPMLGSRCRFHPSCSAYAQKALRTHGFWYGTYLSVYRILRCQPLSKGGFDPVPERTHKAPSG